MSKLNPRGEERIERAIEGRMSETEWDAFKADVVRDSAIRREYTGRAWLQAALRAERDRLPSMLAETEPPHRAWSRMVWLGASLAAAAGMVVAISLFKPRTGLPGADSFATLVSAQNTKWAGSTLPTVERTKLGRGTLALVEGIATLKFASGATVMLEAPTTLEITSAMSCRLIEGSVTAEVPKPARGFTIETPDFQVVDLGTRFGVTAGSACNSHVFVFEGEVRLNDVHGGELRRLTAGRTFHVNSAAAAGPLEPARLQDLKVIDGWTSIPTSFGRGKDAYVRRGYTEGAGGQPLLMVKHSELEPSYRNERRAFLTFDLSQVRLERLAEAQLVLDPEPSGYGFSAMVPDSRFAVYGVTDERLDAWNEATLAWEQSPAAGAGGRMDAGALKKLAEFWIPRGGSGSPLTVRGEALAKFLRTDTNGLATFVVVRETGESDPSGLVHAFAAKEHPTAHPPTLRVR